MEEAKSVSERDYDEDIFCDELEGYAFCPYAKQNGKQKLMSKYKSELRDRYINLWSYSMGNNIRISSLELPNEKRIFIGEKNFNKYWEYICSVIPSTKRQLDLSYLETETKEAYVGTNYKIAYRGKCVDINKQRLMSKRVSAMADPKICYVSSTESNVVHDKTCTETKVIKDETIIFFEKAPKGYELCPNCKRKIWVRIGVKDETKYFNLYYKFLMNMKLSDYQLWRLFEVHGITIHMDIEYLNRLYVKYGEDKWYIQLISQSQEETEQYELFHNNYKIIDNKERIICSGYHKQKVTYEKPSELFNYIGRYNWKIHLKEEREEEVEAPVIAAVTEEQTVNSNFWERLRSTVFSWFEKIKCIVKKR